MLILPIRAGRSRLAVFALPCFALLLAPHVASAQAAVGGGISVEAQAAPAPATPAKAALPDAEEEEEPEPVKAPEPPPPPPPPPEPEPPPPPGPKLTPEQKVWLARDRAVDESSTITGGSGLLHLQHAQGLAPGQFALGFTTELSSANFLCTSSFPCPRPGGGSAITNDTLNHFGADLTLTAGLTKWLEAYGGTSAVANSDSANRPSLLQVLGDTDLGLKAHAPIGKVLHLGFSAELWLVNGTGSVGLDGSGTSGKFRGLATIDLRAMPRKHIPLRISLNTTYSLDNTSSVIADVETARGSQITRIERYSLGINRVDHVDIGIGGEAFFFEQRFRPFAEYNISVPMNRQNYRCNQANISGDNCLQDDQVAPSRLTLGARFLPWKHGFALTAAFDIGITGQNDFIEEMAPVAPWTLYLGAGWAIDTWDRPPVVETKIVTQDVTAPEGHVKGYVHEVGKQDVGVPNAIVAFANHADITSLATSADGHFTTLGLEPGQYDFKITADGYKEGVCSAVLNLNAQNEMPTMATEHESAPPPRGTVVDAAVDCALEALPRVGRVIGHVRTPDKSPVPNASIKLTDTLGHEFAGTADGNGAFRFEGMAPGGYHLEANATDYMTDVEQVEVKSRQDTAADVVLMKSPNLVQVTTKEIVIKQQIQFAFDSAVILPESTSLLTELADVFLKSPQIHKVEIQGHTDSEGTDEHNQMLSEDRANAVKTWLVAHGVPGEKIDAKGYGEKKPLVPNVTANNRARNRRVQFIIIDQDKAAPAAAPAKKP